MYRVEFYAEVRRCVYVEGLSERAAARRFGLALLDEPVEHDATPSSGSLAHILPPSASR